MSTTRPVIRPHAPRVSSVAGVNDTEGDWSQRQHTHTTTHLEVIKQRARNLLLDIRGQESVLNNDDLASLRVDEQVLVERLAQAPLNARSDHTARLGTVSARADHSRQVEVPRLGGAGAVALVGRPEDGARVRLARDSDLPHARAGAGARVSLGSGTKESCSLDHDAVLGPVRVSPLKVSAC